MFNSYPDIVSVEQVMKMVGIGKSSVYTLLRTNRIRHIRFGAKYIIPKKSVIDFVTGVCYNNTECDYLSRTFKKILFKHGLPENTGFHDLRHSCASYILKMGYNMKEIADWLGHADIKTSMNIYAHLDMDAKKGVADRLGSLLSLKS